MHQRSTLDQRALRFLAFRIDSTDLGVQQIAEEQRRLARPLLRHRAVGIKATPPFGLGARHISPADLLRVFQDAGLDGFVFAGCGRGYFFFRSGRTLRTT